VKAVTKLIRAELRKLRKRSLTWVLLYVLVGLMIVFHLLFYQISQITGQTTSSMGNLGSLLGLPLSIPFALGILSSLGAALAAVLAASSIGSEYNWRTIRTALISSEGRLKFLGAKLISIAILILIGMVIGVATGFVMGLITTALGGKSFDFSFATSGYLWDQFFQFFRTFFILLPYVLIGSLFATIGRSAMPGISIGIGILFLEPIVTSFMGSAGGWVSKVPNYLFNANVNAVISLNKLPISKELGGLVTGFSSQPPSIAHAFVVLSVYIVTFAGIAFYLFRKRDVTG
jgi:ABC-2 type transport system permease protein